jgi:polygalacturonase
VACENVIIRRVTVRATGRGDVQHTPNTDGINPDSCRNVLIEHCDIDTGDDSFAIKSGKETDRREVSRPSENIVIRQCRARRVAVGSEVSGGVRNVLIRDCELIGDVTNIIHIKTRRGRGGVVENIWVEGIEAGPAKGAILKVDMEYWTDKNPAPYQPVSAATPRFRNFHFKNITCAAGSNSEAIFINGLPEMPVENITFENVKIATQNGITINHARGVTFKDVALEISDGPVAKINQGVHIAFDDFAFPKAIEPLLILKGSNSGAIRFDPSLSALKGRIVLEDNAPADAVSFASAKN